MMLGMVLPAFLWVRAEFLHSGLAGLLWQSDPNIDGPSPCILYLNSNEHLMLLKRVWEASQKGTVWYLLMGSCRAPSVFLPCNEPGFPSAFGFIRSCPCC